MAPAAASRRSGVPAPLAEFGLKGEENEVGADCDFAGCGRHSRHSCLLAEPETKMVATFRRSKWIAAEHCLLFVFGYAVPIYLLLYVDSCSQWTAIE